MSIWGRISLGVVVVVLVFGAARTAHASAILPGFGGSSLAANDDGFTGIVPIGFTIDFYGNIASNLYLNNNGNVTFTNPLGIFTPFPLTTTLTRIIAPFFGDVDTRSSPANSELMTYGTGTFGGHSAFGVNWGTDVGIGVDYFSASASHTNSNNFQLVIVDRSDTGANNFDFMFNYNLIQWETGQASGGDANGCGGSSARVGWSNGSTTSFELAGSAVNGAFIDSGTCPHSALGPNVLITHSLNSDTAGRYEFNVRGGQVEEPPSGVVPEPASLLLLGSGLAGLAARVRNRRKQA